MAENGIITGGKIRIFIISLLFHDRFQCIISCLVCLDEA
jgi:hypothetical protein